MSRETEPHNRDHDDENTPQNSLKIDGLEAALRSHDFLPVIGETVPLNPDWDETLPLLATLQKKEVLVSFETEPRLTLKVVPLNQKKHKGIFKIAVPISLLPLPRYAEVEAPYVEIAIQHLVELYNLSPAFREQLARILSAIAKLEKMHNLVIRGDGVICKPPQQ